MSKRELILWSVRLPPDLYQWVMEITRREKGKLYLTAQDLADEALRDYKAKLARSSPGRRSDAEILAERDRNDEVMAKRAAYRKRKADR